MSEQNRDAVLTETELTAALSGLPGWEVRDNWLRKTYSTPGWPHTMMLVNTVAFLAEAAWHHPDLNVGYAQVTVKLQTHKVKGITAKDTELAAVIENTVCWQPAEGAALTGFPKKWITGQS